MGMLNLPVSVVRQQGGGLHCSLVSAPLDLDMDQAGRILSLGAAEWIAQRLHGGATKKGRNWGRGVSM